MFAVKQNKNTDHSGLVTTLSMTVPGGGFARFLPALAKNLELILFFTMITPTFGLEEINLNYFKFTKAIS